MPANNKACALFRASNIVAMDYPFNAAVTSVLRFCDEAVIVEGVSYDSTHDALLAIQAEHGADRVKIIQRAWQFDRMWQEKVWNWGAEQTDADWLMYADADEVIMPEDADAIRRVLQMSDVALVNFDLLHFYGTPNWTECTFSGNQTRIGRRSHGFRMVNLCTDETPKSAACAVMFDVNGHTVNAHGWRGSETATVGAKLMHYGWARNAQAMAISQTKHYAWYADGNGLEDGHIPDVPPFDYRMREMQDAGRLVPYDGPHSPDLAGWFAAHYLEWVERDTELGKRDKLFLSDVPAFPPEFAEAMRDICHLVAFVETGTFQGRTTRAMTAHFDHVLTVEGSYARYQAVKNTLPDTVTAYYGDSGVVLPQMLADANAPCLVFLDAHWISNGRPADDDPLQEGAHCPLMAELAAIALDAPHVVVIDDLHFFMRPNNRAGDWPSLDEIINALPGRYVFDYAGMLVAVPNAYRAEVREWLLEHWQGVQRFTEMGIAV